MRPLYDLRLIRRRPEPAPILPSKVIQLESRRAERLERIRRKGRERMRPDAA